jgi:repressor LexA
MRELSAAQRKILSAIERGVEDGLAPTVRELAQALGMKRSTVHYHVQLLRDAGYLGGEGRHRDMTLTHAARAAAGRLRPKAVEAPSLDIPILGRVAAGLPILAVEEATERLSLPELFGGRGELFALVVSGDSMIGDGILDGDFAIVRRQQTAVEGEVVVALVDDAGSSEATIKRLHKEGDAIVLEASNPAYEPLRFEGESRNSVRIVGKLIGILRQMRS